jgi:hypothetical protein
MMNNKICENISPQGVKCSRSSGHTESHVHYEDVKESDGQFCSRIYEWNDDGTTPERKEFGCAFAVNYNNTEEHEKIVQIAIADANRELPAGTVFEIRGKIRPADGVTNNYGRVLPSLEEQSAKWGIAWYTFYWLNAPEREKMPKEPLFRVPVTEAGYDDLHGCMLIARLKTEQP